jgi:hypothetical protein
MAHEFTHLRALVTGVIPDLIMSAWVDVAKEHVATGFYSSFLAFSWIYPWAGNEMATAVANIAPYAHVLEDGHDGYHLPEKIDWGAAEARGTAHRSKKGTRYILVPFRHSTPGAASGGITSGRASTMMRPEVYRAALTALRGDRKRKEAIAARKRLDAAGPWMSRAYSLPAYPAALRARAEAQEGQPGYTWRASKYEGLTRKEQVNPHTGTTSGVYMTFRAVTEDSVGWFIPPAPGYHFAAQTAEAIKPELRELVGEAARADVVELIQARLS